MVELKVINCGKYDGDLSSDTLRSALDKVNYNFEQIRLSLKDDVKFRHVFYEDMKDVRNAFIDINYNFELLKKNG